MEYKNLNEMFKNTLYEDLYFVKMLSLMDNISKDYINLLDNYSDIFDLENDYKNKVNYTTILNVLSFLKEYKFDYYEKLKKFYRNNINIDIDHNDEAYCDFQNGKIFINWPLFYNIDDSFCLIHEFCHSLNLMNETSLSREYLTEAFSILFEFLLFDYLEQKNIKNDDIYKIKMLRFVDCYDNALEIYKNNDIFQIIAKFGKINNKNIEKFNDKKEVIEFIKEKCSDYEEGYINCFSDKKYLLGILLACDIHQRIKDNEFSKQQFIYLLDNINDICLKDCFDLLDVKFIFEKGQFRIDVYDYERIFKNVEIELKETYKKYIGDQNEESYSDSRSNRYWKN